MQTGVLNWGGDGSQLARFLRQEHNLEANDKHLLDFVMKSWTSVQVGCAINGFNLHRTEDLEGHCGETCLRVLLRSAAYDAIADYNPGLAAYGQLVFDHRQLVSPSPETWRP